MRVWEVKDLGLDNFEVEIFEVIEGTQGEEQKMIKLENKQEIDKQKNISLTPVAWFIGIRLLSPGLMRQYLHVV